jgi:hypothetical protein
MTCVTVSGISVCGDVMGSDFLKQPELAIKKQHANTWRDFITVKGSHLTAGHELRR